VCLRAVPHDTKDDVLEKFLSKILPGSGTVYRSGHRHTTDHRTASSTPASDTPPSVTLQTDQRTSPNATRSTVAARVESALYEEEQSLRKTIRKMCKSVPMDSSDGYRVQMNRLCYRVSSDTVMLPAAP